MNPSENFEGKSNVLIVMGDGRYGSLLERYLCEKHTRNFDQIVGLVDVQFKELEGRRRSSLTSPSNDDDPSKADEDLPSSCKVEYIDFKSIGRYDSDLTDIIQKYKINWLCLVPFGDTFHDSEMVQTVLLNFKKNRGTNVLLLSSIGADSNKVPLTDLSVCEDKVLTQFPTRCCILRMQVPMEDLDFFGRDVRKNKTWRLPSGDGTWAPVSFTEDVVLVAATIMKALTIETRFANQTYVLTGKTSINGITLADLTSVAFNERDVKFAIMTPDEARNVMDEEVKRRGRKRSTSDRDESELHKPAIAPDIDGVSTFPYADDETIGTPGNTPFEDAKDKSHSSSVSANIPSSAPRPTRRRSGGIMSFLNKTFNLSNSSKKKSGSIFGDSSQPSAEETRANFGMTGNSDGSNLGKASVGGKDIEYTSKIEREIILNRFELIREHNLNMITDDVKNITGQEPLTIPAYLRVHEDYFKGKN